MALVEPRTLKGFRDYLPSAMAPRERLLQQARDVFRSFGYEPIDTPAIEFLEILAGKGGTETDRQIYRFEDAGGRLLGLRFDLTVPLARFVAQHAAELTFPFKRYHMGTVWRGENPQHGRYREFMQCDFDAIGTSGLASDVETGLVIHELLTAIGFGGAFQMRLNNRRVLTGLLRNAGIDAAAADVLRAIDKWEKIGPDGVRDELRNTAGVSDRQAEAILCCIAVRGGLDDVLAALDRMAGKNDDGARGIAELRDVATAMLASGVSPRQLTIDVSIARGLDYYTGMVYETVLDALPGIGSVCSGGRYDNLAELFTDQQLPGIGASLGLDRLLAAMEELGMCPPQRPAADVFMPLFDAARLPDYARLAMQLRRQGLGVDVFTEPKRLGQQLRYADRRGYRCAVIAGEREFADGIVQIKWLADGSQENVPLDPESAQLAQRLREGLTRAGVLHAADVGRPADTARKDRPE